MIPKWVPIAFLLSTGLAVGDAPVENVIASDISVWRYYNASVNSDRKLTVCPLPPRRLKKEEIFDIIAQLNSRSMEISEPSEASEQQYINAIRNWLNSLDPARQERAHKIMREAHSGLHALREAIRDKKHELASISFSKGVAPETLPRLGMELQNLRADLDLELRKVSERLKKEAGIVVEIPDSQSFWFTPGEVNIH